mmetsp:Transcript_24080/g.23989  ORF Transcript_24080/g.23989 Transcript_24080/m.23989 type:complete len:227 (-) Transcript_24080:37-717(-)
MEQVILYGDEKRTSQVVKRSEESQNINTSTSGDPLSLVSDILSHENQTKTLKSHGNISGVEEIKQEFGASGNENSPILINKDYILTPSLDEMTKMTKDQLSSIKELSIQNCHGKISWTEEIDVRGINFDELVQIVPFAITVYPTEIERKGLKPEIGKGLNKPANISIFNLKQPGSDTRTAEEFENCLKQRISQMPDSEFVSYSKKDMTLMFKVQHFTTYEIFPELL